MFIVKETKSLRDNFADFFFDPLVILTTGNSIHSLPVPLVILTKIRPLLPKVIEMTKYESQLKPRIDLSMNEAALHHAALTWCGVWYHFHLILLQICAHDAIVWDPQLLFYAELHKARLVWIEFME